MRQKEEPEEQKIQQFQLEEIVWAKITGYPWWPAKVTGRINPKTNCHRVDFFTDNTHAFLTISKIAKYDEMRCNIDLNRQIAKTLRKAIAEADDALQRQTMSINPPLSLPAPAEAINLNEKQLLNQSLPTPTHIQSNISPNTVESRSNGPSPQQQSSSEEQSCRSLDKMAATGSRQQRERLVNNLLQKYKLVTLPKGNIGLTTPKICRNSQSQTTKSASTKKTTNTKTKRIKKLNKNHTLYALLSRKLHKLLKQKSGLNNPSRKQMSLNLSHELLGGIIDPKQVNKVFKWIISSSSEAIASSYNKGVSLQFHKQTLSSITIQD